MCSDIQIRKFPFEGFVFFSFTCDATSVSPVLFNAKNKNRKKSEKKKEISKFGNKNSKKFGILKIVKRSISQQWFPFPFSFSFIFFLFFSPSHVQFTSLLFYFSSLSLSLPLPANCAAAELASYATCSVDW